MDLVVVGLVVHHEVVDVVCWMILNIHHLQMLTVYLLAFEIVLGWYLMIVALDWLEFVMTGLVLIVVGLQLVELRSVGLVVGMIMIIVVVVECNHRKTL